MSTRYVWNKYSCNTGYQFHQVDVENISQSKPFKCGEKDSDAGSDIFLALFKSQPIPTGRGSAKYTGTYTLLDGTNDRTFYTSEYPWAAVVANDKSWAPNARKNDGFPEYPSAGNTYSGTITLHESWATSSSYGVLYHASSPNGAKTERWYPRSQHNASLRGYYLNLSYAGTDPGEYLYEYEIETIYSQGSTSYGQVTSADSGAYPANSYSGSYWYRSQGSDTIDPAAVTLPASIFGGDTVAVNVTPSSGKTYGGTVSYTYQYRLDGGAWETLATTTETSQTITVPKGTSTVEVQVCAQDDLGFTSAAWVSSGAVSVTNNLAPTAPGSIQVSGVVAGDSVTVTLTPAADPDGSVSEYIIQRQIDGGDWIEVQRSAALTFTQTVSGDWSTLAFRAAAVDNEGAQGPYITSETLPVSRGAVTITGPEADQGTHSGPFDLTVTLGITGSPQTPDLHFSAALDGVEAVSAAHQAGDQITLRLYPQAMPRGAHVLKVTATKEDYMAASQSYTYTIPEWDGSDIEGGWSGVIQDPTGRKLLPKTLAQDCLGPGGKDMATLITELKQQMGQLSPAEDVIRQAPPSGSFELTPGTLYDFTQAAAADLTFTLGAAEGTRAAAYHVLFQSGATPTAVHLPEGIRTPDGYAIEAGRVYELSILENLLTFQSWEAST